MRNRKRILIITLAWTPVESGGEIAPRKIAEMLADEYMFDVLCYRFAPGHQATEQTPYGHIYRVGGYGHGHLRKNLWTIQAGMRALSLHRQKKYDAIWVVMAAYGAGAATIFNLFNPKVPILLTLQEGDPIEHIYKRLGILRPFWHRFFTKVSTVQAISHYLAGVAKTCGFPGRPIVVPNGVDVPVELEARSSKLGEKEKVVLISNSRLERKNGLDIVIRALALLPRHIVFKNAHEGSERELLLKLARECGVSDRVTLDPILPYTEAVEYLKQGDIFVRPSRSEGLGASFLEAMAVGVPIIGTPVGGIPDFLKDPSNTSGQVVTGIFCDPESPESFAGAVLRLIESPELYEKVRKGGYELVTEKFSWQSVGERMRKLFAGLW